MSGKIRIAVDAMSGDLGPRVVIAAAVQVLRSYPQAELILVGDQPMLESLLSSVTSFASDRLSVLHAAEQVSMDEDPLHALRHKKQSSMWLALSLVQKGAADACVSAGNTGALMAISKHLLKMQPSIERPAICKSMPVAQGRTYMLDLGANPVCTSEQLAQFGLMGSILAATTLTEKPRVMLLNIGTEESKGTGIIHAAQELLRNESRVNYRGYIEADKIYTGLADVIVCDGFAGNIALKASEGVARFIAKKIEASLTSCWWRKALALPLLFIVRQWRKELNPGRYNGAIFLGLQKTVVKSHGGADQQAFAQALIVAIEQVIQQVPARIEQHLAKRESPVSG